MHSSLPLVTTIATALGLALVLGFIAVRLKLPALVGYLVAGVLLGPATPGLVADVQLAHELAEIGVMLLMFGVGLHFSWEDLWEVRKVALPGALAQIVVATALGAGVAHLWGWSFGAGLVFGLALSVASTVVLLRALEAHDLLESRNGHIAVGWLIVEDLFMVLVLVLLPPLAAWLGGGPLHGVAESGAAPAILPKLLFTLFEVLAFIALMYIVGRRLFPWVLWQAARTGSRELFVLCVIAAAVGIAFASAQIFGISFALGAFFAGMVLKESSLSHRAAAEILSLQDAFSVLFFVSVGMLFDPALILREPLHILIVVAIVLLGKTLAAFLLVLGLRLPLNTALTVSAGLAQVGEFSFILTSLGVSLNLLPEEGQSLVLAAALISISLNPLVFGAIEPVQEWVRSRSRLARVMERQADPLAELPRALASKSPSGHVVLVGYGRVGRRIGEALAERRVPFVVAEQDREIVDRLREKGVLAVLGDASHLPVLVEARAAQARMLVVAVPDAFLARKMLELAMTLKPGIDTVVRVHSDEEAALLRKEKAGRVFMGEHELATGMTRYVLERIEAEGAPAHS